MQFHQTKPMKPARVFPALVQSALVFILTACGTFAAPQPASPATAGKPTATAIAAATPQSSGAQAGTAPTTTAQVASVATATSSSAALPQTGKGQTFQVKILDNSFDPANLTIPVGSTVVWTDSGQHPHTVTADDNSFTSDTLKNGGTFQHTFDKPGTFNYFCQFHGSAGGVGMAGVVTVTAASGPSVSTSTPAASGAAATPTTAASSNTSGPTATPSAASGGAAAAAPEFLPFGPVNRDPNQAAQSPGLAVGSTTAGGPANAWIAWAENSAGNVRQIFTSERVVAAQPAVGAFQPRGASLNIHANVIGDIPTITFAGQDRTVPWVAWQEPSPGFGNVTQIFASRFNAATQLWQPAGQDRGGSEASINIHTNRAASLPFIFSGSGDPTKPPVPWITWLEQSNVSNALEVFVSKAVKDDKAIGGFHWQPVGKVDSFNEPTLNVDRAREADHPAGIFAGQNNTVPWITWYEKGNNRPDRVFAAKGVADPNAPGGFNWVQVPACKPDETACTLNNNPLHNGVDPTIAPGSLNPGSDPVPWIAWTETGPTGKTQILVSRLDPSTKNSFLQVGGSLNVDQNHNAITPFISFVKNVPYVAWLEDNGGGNFAVQVRHLASDAQTGNWKLDTPSNGFSTNPNLPETGLFASGSDTGLFLAWTEGDPTKGASQVITGELKP